MTICYLGEFTAHPQRQDDKVVRVQCQDKVWHAYLKRVEEHFGRPAEKSELYTIYWCWSKGVEPKNVNL